jgi:hypothetical protein
MTKKKPIVSKYGQWKYPGQETIIPNANGRITMQDVPYPVFGIDDQGNQQMMMPGQEYKFPGDSVYEIPMTNQNIMARGFDTSSGKSTGVKWPTELTNEQRALDDWQRLTSNGSSTFEKRIPAPDDKTYQQLLSRYQGGGLVRMQPGEDHQFDGNYVLEMPLNKMNGKITDPTVIQRLIDNHRKMRNGGSLRIFQGDTDPSTVPTDPPMIPLTGVPYAYQTPVVGAPNQWMPLPEFSESNTYQADISNTNRNQDFRGYINYNPDEFNRENGNISSSFPMNNIAYRMPQVNAVGAPNRGTKYAREFMTQNPDPNNWEDGTDPNSPVTEKFLGSLLGIGKTATNPYTGEGWGYNNRKTNYQNAKTDYIAMKILGENPQGDRSRQEWLASFSPGELATLQQSKKFSGEVAANKWAAGAQGLLSSATTGLLSPAGLAMRALPEDMRPQVPNLFPEQLSEEEAKNAGILDALGMVTIPAEGLKGMITEGSGRGFSGASPIDYTGGRDIVLDEFGNAIIDPLNLVGMGIGKQAIKGVRAAKPFIQAGTEIGTRTATGLLNKTGSFLESKAGIFARDAVPGYQAFNDIDPNVTARAASTNTIGGAFDYKGRTYQDMYDAVLNSNLPDDQIRQLLNNANANVGYTSKTKAEFLNDLKPLAEQDARFAAYPETVRQQITDELTNQGTNWKNLDAQDRALVLNQLETQHGAPSSVAAIAEQPSKEIQTLPNYAGGDLPAGFQAEGPRDFTGVVAPEDMPSSVNFTRGPSGNAVRPNKPIPASFNDLDEVKTFFGDHANNIGLSSREKAAVNDNIQALYDSAIMSGADPRQALYEVRNALDRGGYTRMDGRRTASGFESITKMPKNANESAKISAARNGYNAAQTKSLELNIDRAAEKLMADQGLSKEEAFRRAHAAALDGSMPAKPLAGWSRNPTTRQAPGSMGSIANPPDVNVILDNVAKDFNLSKKDTKLLKEGYNDITANIQGDAYLSEQDRIDSFAHMLNESDNPFDMLINANQYGYQLTNDASRYEKVFGKYGEVPKEGTLDKFLGKVTDEVRAGRRAARRDEFVTPLTEAQFKGAVKRNKQGIVDLNSSPQYRPSTEQAVTNNYQQATPALFAKNFTNERKMLESVTRSLDSYLANGITGSTSTSHNSYVVQMDYIMKTIKNPDNAGKLEPAFLGFQPMNSYGYMSKAGANNEEILKLINNKLNNFQKKTGVNLQFEDKFPYIDANGQIMLPQWGIKKLTDAPVVAKKKYGGEVSYNEKPFLGYIPFDYTKAYGL